MTSPKEIIMRYGIRPRKKLSQSFLLDQNIIRKIAAAAGITETDIVVEIGAGIGVLTAILAPACRKLIAVELDEKLVEVLQEKLAGYDNAEIYSGDILKYDFNILSSSYNSKIKVIGNIPYGISSPLIFCLLTFRPVINEFILMLQKEVIDRLIADPGNKTYGIPSVLVQMFASVEKLFDVPAGCFYPRPKVESAVMRGTFRNKPQIELTDEGLFTRLVKASFAQRRKMLINNLKHSALFANLEERSIKEILLKAGIDGQKRAENLSVCEFGKLSNTFAEMQWNDSRRK
ncbi:MAG TPA: 16S rRNA (adenine(1518)-N(6)/adenine(1519)-N(6))-dimethyltransferase RsmA [Smithellaceae bacterium]|nr:16S rRNA (adenine(1518)-N(6)/adenine(1519)-N(6))-dimethyltransferase RsmA [Smithellaceae bacterium]